jgi:sec-independent protein translocase protein TatA
MVDLSSPLVWFLIAIIVIILFGGKKLPEVARGAGQAVREFRKAAEGKYDQEEEEKRRMILEVARKLGVNTEGKSIEEIENDIIAKAREKGLLEDQDREKKIMEIAKKLNEK